jgi:hypothetical protein
MGKLMVGIAHKCNTCTRGLNMFIFIVNQLNAILTFELFSLVAVDVP